jgi:hypothetical protein
LVWTLDRGLFTIQTNGLKSWLFESFQKHKINGYFILKARNKKFFNFQIFQKLKTKISNEFKETLNIGLGFGHITLVFWFKKGTIIHG